jgi:hypothetical protein
MWEAKGIENPWRWLLPFLGWRVLLSSCENPLNSEAQKIFPPLGIS